MPFRSPRQKGRVHVGLRQTLRGGQVMDFNQFALVSGQAVGLNTNFFESRVSTNNSGEMVCTLPVNSTATPLKLGQRHLVTYDVEGAAADSVAISGVAGASGSQINIEALVISGVTNYARTAFTRVSLLSGNDAALFEYAGTSGTTHVWNLLYTNSATVIPS